MTAFLAPPRLAAALITALLILTCVLVGTANAAPTDFCSPGVTTTFKGVDGNGLTIDKGATLDLEATGNNAPGFTPDAPSQPGGSANVQVDSYSNAPTSFINNGTINATSSDGAWGESLNVAGTLVNAGSINDQSGKLTFQGQNLPYLVNNTGSLAVASGASFTMIAGAPAPSK
jgi:hypothetical protein